VSYYFSIRGDSLSPITLYQISFDHVGSSSDSRHTGNLHTNLHHLIFILLAEKLEAGSRLPNLIAPLKTRYFSLLLSEDIGRNEKLLRVSLSISNDNGEEDTLFLRLHETLQVYCVEMRESYLNCTAIGAKSCYILLQACEFSALPSQGDGWLASVESLSSSRSISFIISYEILGKFVIIVFWFLLT